MKHFKTNPAFAALMLCAALLVAAESWWFVDRRGAAQAAERQLKQAFNRLQDFSRVSPSPTERVAEALERQSAVAAAARSTMREALAAGTPQARQILGTPPPAQRADAFFDIARFVDAQRNAARAAGVEIADGELFGFSTYANSGPVNELIPAVHRQRLVAEYLIESAFAARPRRFDGLAREPPRANEGGPGEGARPRADGPDFFTLNPRISARRPGFVRTIPFRVRFSGQTSALRSFLNELATYQLPLLVRSVEVEPAAELNQSDLRAPVRVPVAVDPFAGVFGGGAEAATAAAETEVAVPIVAENFSRFTITVEYLELEQPVLANESDEAEVQS